jgi:hypothetical protein
MEVASSTDAPRCVEDVLTQADEVGLTEHQVKSLVLYVFALFAIHDVAPFCVCSIANLGTCFAPFCGSGRVGGFSVETESQEPVT